MFISIIFAVK